MPLQFMLPQKGGPCANPVGLTINFCVPDVDATHQRLVETGHTITLPIADHPWGDRGFSIQDPNGIALYIYSEREPSVEFKPIIHS